MEVTNGVRRQIITSNNFIVKIDRKTPTIAVGSNPLSLGNGDYTFTNNVAPSYGDSGGNISCNPANSRKTGTYTVTCTATSGSGLKSSVSFSVRHSYAARYVQKTCTTQQNCNCRQEEYCVRHESCNPWWCPDWSQGCCDGCHQTGQTVCCEEYATGTKCDTCTVNYDCSYYDCPNGGTLNGTTCYY